MDGGRISHGPSNVNPNAPYEDPLLSYGLCLQGVKLEYHDANGAMIGFIDVPTNTWSAYYFTTNGTLRKEDPRTSLTVVKQNGDGTTTTSTVYGWAEIDRDLTIRPYADGHAWSVTTTGNGEIVKLEWLGSKQDGMTVTIMTPGEIWDEGNGLYWTLSGQFATDLFGENGERIGTITVINSEVDTNGTTYVRGSNGQLPAMPVKFTRYNADGSASTISGFGPATITRDGTITFGEGGVVRKVEIDIDGDDDAEVVVTPGEGGTIADNGDGSYDVTGPSEIELVDVNGVIEVPTNTTVTVGSDGVTTVDEGETVTVVTDNGDGTTTETPVVGPAEIDPDGTIRLGYTTLDGTATITAWQQQNNGAWRLTFTVPETGLTGDVAKLMPDRSFSVKFARALVDISQAGEAADGQAYGHLGFDITEATTAGGIVSVTLTITDARMNTGSSLFVKIVDPKGL